MTVPFETQTVVDNLIVALILPKVYAALDDMIDLVGHHCIPQEAAY